MTNDTCLSHAVGRRGSTIFAEPSLLELTLGSSALEPWGGRQGSVAPTMLWPITCLWPDGYE